MSNFFVFLERCVQLKTVNPLVTVGQILCSLGFGGGAIITIAALVRGIPLSFEWSMGNSAVLGFMAGLIGIVMLVIGAFLPVQAARSTIVSLMGIPGVSENVPDKSVGKPYCLYNPRHFEFVINKMQPKEMVERINNYCREAVDELVIKNSRNGKVFFAGLARVPCLFAMGTLFRSSAVEVEPLERFRNPDKWGRLGLFRGNPNQYAITGNPEDIVTSGKEIGIVVSLKDEVQFEQIPDFIRDHCVSLKLEPEPKREAISNLPDLHEFARKFKVHLDRCSKVADVVHLFVCAQSSVVFEMGRTYQEGMHSKLVVHNYTPGEGYSWSAEIDKGIIKYRDRKTT